MKSTCKRNIRNTLKKGLARTTALGLAATMLSTGVVQAAPKGPYSKLVSLGDSLSDTGNFYQATGQTIPPFPYFEGRASNGILWNEWLAAKLGIPFDQADRYAWFGAMTGTTNFRSIPEAGIFFPGFKQQVDALIADLGPEGADPAALYSIWVGANDIFSWLVTQNQTPQQVIATGVTNTIAGIHTLAF